MGSSNDRVQRASQCQREGGTRGMHGDWNGAVVCCIECRIGRLELTRLKDECAKNECADGGI